LVHIHHPSRTSTVSIAQGKPENKTKKRKRKQRKKKKGTVPKGIDVLADSNEERIEDNSTTKTER